MLKRNHVLDMYTKRGCQDMLRAAELLSEQRPIPPSSRQLVRQRGHVNKKPSSMVEGARTPGRGKAGRETSVRRVDLGSNEKIPAQNQSSSANQGAPPCVLLLVSLQWQGGDGGKGLLGRGFLSAI